MRLTPTLWQLVPEELHPPLEDAAAILGWLVALLLAAGIWFVRTRERERQEELKVWRDIAQKRELALAEERTKYEAMVKETTTFLERNANVLNGLREHLNEQGDESKIWRQEVREAHTLCITELKRLQDSVSNSPRGT